MKILLLVRNIGPAEGTVYNLLCDEGHEVNVYDVNGEWLHPNRPVPLWMKGYRMRRSILASNYLHEAIGSEGYDRIIAVGLEPSGFAAQTLEFPFIPLLLRGSLDYSDRRKNLVTDFEAVLNNVDRLLLDDDWEMDKACAKGSKLPHLRAPLLHPQNSESVLSDSAKPSIALIYPVNSDQARVNAYRDGINSAIPGVEVAMIHVEDLYTTRDLRRNRKPTSTLRLRLEAHTHLVFVGTSAHHAPVLSLLRPDWSNIVVEETIGARYFSDDLGFTATGRGLNLVALLRQIVACNEGGTTPPVEEPGVPTLMSQLDEVMNRSVSEFYEELTAFSGSGPLNIFFSVASLEDRTNGARPQRIRNLAQSLAEAGPTIRVFAAANTTHRRLSLLRSHIAQGRAIGIFYGENSTTPIASDEVIDDVSAFLEEFRDAGGRSGFFIRDLYWLEDKEDYVNDAAELQNMRTRGARELEDIADRCDVLFAPVRATGRLYNQLLEGAGQRPRDWHPLPPAVAPANVCDTASLLGDNLELGTTLLYAGGQGAVYGMDRFLTAITQLPRHGYWFDFIARPGEVEHLIQSLADYGLADDPRVRISTNALDTHLPRTSRCIGINLLDSDYAKAGFQYKTVSMLERGFSMLCFEDMAIADFVTGNRVGIACERSTESIISSIAQIEEKISPEDLDVAQRSQTWQLRVEEILEALTA